MDLAGLLSAKCVACEGGAQPFSSEQVSSFLKMVPTWSLNGAGHLCKQFKLKDFVAAMDFLNKVAQLAEGEGHHPDFSVHYNKVDFEIWTHAVKGLTENDFILAAKIDGLARGQKFPAITGRASPSLA